MSSLRQSAKNYKRVVVKVGSSLFYRGRDLNLADFFNIVLEISLLVKNQKAQILVVSSGAIALGMHRLSLRARPAELSYLQACAAVGQNELMDKYNSEFVKHGICSAQVLLTWEDFDSRARYLNAKKTLVKLLELGVVPVINENDTVSTEEIKFGDNDRLSAMTANLVGADLLVILSDVDGLLDKEKNTIRLVSEINQEISRLAEPAGRKTSVGGMIAKIEAARIAMHSGIPCVIANGRSKEILSCVIAHPAHSGTLFQAKKTLSARQRWIAFGTKAKGRIVVDQGAKDALLSGKSLLSVGVKQVTGNFASQDIVSLIDNDGIEFARAKANMACGEIEASCGRRSDKEAVHRDNIVLL